MNRVTLLIAGVLVAPLIAAPALTVRDVDGRTRTLLAPPPHQLDLLFFISPDCPISNRYAPEIQRICSEYGSRGVSCYAIYPDADAGAIKRHRQEYGFKPAIPALSDSDHSIVRSVGPRVTPEAAVYSSAGRVYKGRIDDLYIDVGRARRAPTRHDLRLAIDDALAGKSPGAAQTDAVGCAISTP